MKKYFVQHRCMSCCCGPIGPAGMGPTVTVFGETHTTYILQIDSESGTIITPNLRSPSELYIA